MSPLKNITGISAILVSLGISLWGVLFLGWDWREMMVFYWLTNITFGIVTIITIARSNPSADSFIGAKISSDGTEHAKGITPTVIKVFGLIFFCIHYGIFTLVHGVFVFAIVSGEFVGFENTAGLDPVNFQQLYNSWIWVCVATILPRFFMPVTEQNIVKIMSAPYKRIGVLHVTIIIGSILITLFQLPAIAALMLVGLNAIFELVSWRGEITDVRRSAAPIQTSSTTQSNLV